MIQIDLSEQNILVTGASDGIGRAIALFLMEMGAKVAIHYHQNKTSAKELVRMFPETNSQIFKADFSDPSEVVELWKKITSEFNRIDAIVLNAGVFLKHPVSRTHQEWLTTWKKTMSINLDAAGLLTKMGIDHFKSHGGGRFIYIASRAVFRGETEEYLAYAASKGGMVSLGRSVARSFGKSNIKAFMLAPGFTKTKMAEQFIADYGEDRLIDELALTELTTPRDIAPLVGFMCSGMMDHATGATIDVNAGSHIR